MERLKIPALVLLSLGLSTVISCAASLSISSLSGPVTTAEINSFITYMQAQTPPQTPWGAVNGTTGDHNEWADGTGGRDLEAMGEMYEITSNVTILNQMISWSDDCTSQRNDLMSAANGGQRVMWTGKIDEVWCPNEPSSANAEYAGCENEDTEGHLAFCAKLILESPGLWNLTVPDGNPYGYGITYFQRATNYLAKCDQANEEYSLIWFFKTGSSLIVAPTNAAWVAFDENVTANNRQMMFTSGFQRLAEAHAILGDNPALEAQYNAIVQATINQDLTGMVNYDPYLKNGQTVYDWGYYPTSDAPETTEIHAEYDLIGVWRAFNNTNYGVTLAPLVPFANTMVNVVYLGTNTFAGNVDGGGGTQSPIYSGWLLTADWNPQVYTIVAGVAYTNGWYTGSEDIDAAILFMKNRRYQEFSVTPLQSSQSVAVGSNAQFAVAVAPLGGFTGTVNLTVTGLPSGAMASFTPSSINCAALNYFSTNCVLTIQTTGSTPVGTYAVSVIGTSGAVSHTNLVTVVVGTYSLSASPSLLAIAPGNTANYTITTTTNTGFSGTVSFGLSGLPANCSATFNPTSLGGSGLATLSVVVSNNAADGTYALTIYGTNGANVINTTTMLQIAGAGTAIWNGGSAADNFWSDPANWSGATLFPGANLLFGGNRVVNTNDTSAGTQYNEIIFLPGAGSFDLNGNAITITSNVLNQSSVVQTDNVPTVLTGNSILNAGTAGMVVGGGVTNISPTLYTLHLEGTNGVLSGPLQSIGSGLQENLGLQLDLAAGGSNTWSIVGNNNDSFLTNLTVAGGQLTFGTGSDSPFLAVTNETTQPLNIGTTTNTTAVFTINSGTFDSYYPKEQPLEMGAAGSTGILNVNGGTFNLNGKYIQIGDTGGKGIINLSGGIINADASGDFILGNQTNASGVLNVSGGTINIPENAFVGFRGPGTWNISGSGRVVVDTTLNMVRNNVDSPNASGIVNLNGGTLIINQEAMGNASGTAQTGAFNFNGGVLEAAASSTTFLSPASPPSVFTTTIQAGGAMINDGGNAITITGPLLHDSTLGSTPDGGLAKSGGGTLTLTGANTYTGPTTISNGTLALSGSASIANSPGIAIAGGTTFDVSGLSSIFALGAGQVLSNSTSTAVINGTISAGPGTLSLMYAAGTPSLNIAGGTLALSSGTALTINNTGPALEGGTYLIIAAGGGTVDGALPSSFTVSGNSIAGGTMATLQMASGGLELIVTPPASRIIGVSLNGLTLNITATNGAAGGRYVLLESTNVTLPLNQWVRVLTNNFDRNGNAYLSTNIINPNNPLEFYLLSQ